MTDPDHVSQPQANTTAATGSKVVSFLAQRDVPCPACGYNLRGVTQEACPECAMPLTMADLRGKGAVMKHWVVPTLVSVVVINLLMVLFPRVLASAGINGVAPLGGLRYEFIVIYGLAIGIPTLNWYSNRRHAWTRWRARPNEPLDRWMPHVLITMAAIAGASISISLTNVPFVFNAFFGLLQRDPLAASRGFLASIQFLPFTVCYIALCVTTTQDRANTWARRSIIATIATFGIIALFEGAMYHMY